MTTVDVVAMPVSEKLKLMETLWDSLCVQSGGNMELPAWHGEVLEQRLRRLASGVDCTAPRQAFSVRDLLRSKGRHRHRSGGARLPPESSIDHRALAA